MLDMKQMGSPCVRVKDTIEPSSGHCGQRLSRPRRGLATYITVVAAWLFYSQLGEVLLADMTWPPRT